MVYVHIAIASIRVPGEVGNSQKLNNQESNDRYIIRKDQKRQQRIINNYIRTGDFELEVGQDMTTLLAYILIGPGPTAQTARSE